MTHPSNLESTTSDLTNAEWETSPPTTQTYFDPDVASADRSPLSPNEAEISTEPVVSAGTSERVTQDETCAASKEEEFQRAYLLQQLKDAPEQTLAKGKANRFPRGVTRELKLTPTFANQLRDQLVEEGYIQVTRKGGSLNYELTRLGDEYLATLEQKTFPAARSEEEEIVTEENRRYRRTFLLFQLFESPDHELDQKTINRFREPGRKFLHLKAGAANELREQLVNEGLLAVEEEGRDTVYRLTAAGREHLGATAHFPDIELTITGRVLNELLEAARESTRQFEPVSARSPERGQPEATEIETEEVESVQMH